MALGLPVIAYDTAVHREYLGDAGRFVPPHDVSGLVAAIDDLAEDGAAQQRLGGLLRERVSELFTWKSAARRIDGVYDSLQGGAGSAADRIKRTIELWTFIK